MFSNWINKLLTLSDQIWDLIEKTAAIAEIEVKDQDSRLIALSGMQQSVLSCAFWLNTYNNIADKHKDESMILRYAGSNLPLKETADIMINQIRLGLVIFFHFKLENLLGTLLNKISNKKPSGLSQVFMELSKEININESQEKANIIKAFSSIRNSLHNNGIHAHSSFSIKVNGIDYEFIKDGVVQCASLEHSIKLIQSILDIIEEVLNSEKIKSIKEIIPDTYAEWLDKENA